MIRNIQAMVVAVLALAAFSASGAQAAQFHCSVSPCTFKASPDGSGSQAHHVFIVENSTTTESVSFTCSELKGLGTSSTATAEKLTIGSIEYPAAGCRINGTPGLEVVMNGCKYEFSASGTVTITGCNEGKGIELKLPGGCIFSIAAQGPLSGITYTTLGSSPSREVTVSTKVHPIVVIRNAACEVLIKATSLTGTYTTGNTKVTAEIGGVMADGWWTA